MASEKVFDTTPVDYDGDSYDEEIVVAQADNIKQMVNELPMDTPTARDLLIYFANRYKEVHGFEYVVEWVKEVTIFKSFIDRYGVDAGPMVQLLFDKHQGKLDDMVLTVTAFTKGSKWIQDKLHIELQQDRKKKANATSTEGLMDTDEFLKRFTL